MGVAWMINAPSSTLFEEILDFLLSNATPEEIILFQPSEVLQGRLRTLLERNRNGVLTSEESAELDDFVRMNHFMSMLKIRARRKLAPHQQ
jgi:hypothetical protein